MLKYINLDAVSVSIFIFAKKIKVMQVVSAREFRANQGKYLIKANEGQSVLLTSRYGNFKIVPISEEDNLTTRICRGLQQVKLIEEGKKLRYVQEENDRLRNEIKDLQVYKEKAYRELCRIRDEQKTFGKIHVNTEL
jgi:prevent-host-death family protein